MRMKGLILILLLLCTVSFADFIYLKDGTVIEGNVTGETKKDLMVESTDGSKVIEKDRIEHVEKEAPEVNKSRIMYEDGTKLGEQSEKYREQGEYIKAVETFNQAKELLGNISDSTKYVDLKKNAIIKIENSLDGIDKELNEKGLVIYKNKLISKQKMDEINKHLAKGEILFEGKAWIMPEQLCVKCNHRGQVKCDECIGNGKTRVKCTNCESGYILCPKCNGKGSRTCSNCNGNGGVIVKCTNCDGAGTTVCGFCKGSGEQYRSCEVCGGTGQIREYRSGYLWTISCAGCKRGKVVEPCRGCRGQGRIICSKCNGKGEYWKGCKVCNNRGIVSCPEKVSCSKCGGKSIIDHKCKKCNGTRKMECPDCNGAGFTQQSSIGEKKVK